MTQSTNFAPCDGVSQTTSQMYIEGSLLNKSHNIALRITKASLDSFGCNSFYINTDYRHSMQQF